MVTFVESPTLRDYLMRMVHAVWWPLLRAVQKPLTWVGDLLSTRYRHGKYKLSSSVILWLLSFSSDEYTRKNIIYNGYLPLSVIERLVRDSSPVIREALVDSDRLDTVLLDMLSRDTVWRVRAAVASNQGTSAETLHILAQDEHSFVREDVAFNLSTLVATLDMLLSDGSDSVRRRAAANPGFDAEVLRGIASITSEPNICFGLAHNPNVPVDVLCKLLSCGSREVTGVVWDKVFALSDEGFATVLHTIGYGELVGLPRDWVRQVLSE